MISSELDAWIPEKFDRSRIERCRGGFSVYSVQLENNALAGKSIFFFSDLHLRSEKIRSIFPAYHAWCGGGYIQKILLDALTEYAPDYVIFGGDLISEAVWFERAFDLLKTLPGKIKLAVNGNWDIHRCCSLRDPALWKKHYDSAGFKLLINENFSSDGIDFYGADDVKTGVTELPREYDFSPNAFRVLVTHNPDAVPMLKTPADLILCGHTHGGQCRLPGYGALKTSCIYGKKFEFGSYRHKENNALMLVSAGIGCSFLRIRLFCPPQAYLIRFIREKKYGC